MKNMRQCPPFYETVCVCVCVCVFVCFCVCALINDQNSQGLSPKWRYHPLELNYDRKQPSPPHVCINLVFYQLLCLQVFSQDSVLCVFLISDGSIQHSEGPVLFPISRNLVGDISSWMTVEWSNSIESVSTFNRGIYKK